MWQGRSTDRQGSIGSPSPGKRLDRPGGAASRPSAPPAHADRWVDLHHAAGNQTIASLLGTHTRAQSDLRITAALEVFEGPTTELPFRADMERAFGGDLRDVRVVTGSRVETAARTLDARAWAFEDGVAFADARPARRSVAHELAHVMQWRAGPRATTPSIGIAPRGSHAESEAQAAADNALSGGPVIGFIRINVG